MTSNYQSRRETQQITSQSDDADSAGEVGEYKTALENIEKIFKGQEEKIDQMKKEIQMLKDRTKIIDQKDLIIRHLETKLEKETIVIHEKQATMNALEKNLNDMYRENQDHLEEINELKKNLSDVLNENRSLKLIIEQMKRDQEEMEYRHSSKVRKLTEDIKSLTAQRDDTRERFSKEAGAKLSDNNADIADLSDPNRAMKLAERFAALFDDEWTDAFQEQKEKIKKKSDKDVAQNLLHVLVDCFQFCQKIADQQMDVLNNVLLHPCQDASLDRNISGVQKGYNQPRIHSKDVKILKEARRKIATEAICEVKEQFITKMKQDSNTDKKAMECSMSYYEKCAEICWHMVLHDPVLYMKLDVKEGDKMDLNLFTIYQSSGTVFEYLVWPPLFNGKDGGLLNKGVAQPTKTSGKGGKK